MAERRKVKSKYPKLTADMVYGFVQEMLMPGFDSPSKIPKFHTKIWNMCCSDNEYVAFAAPRGHGKTTTLCFSYLLASILFRESDFVIVVSDTETQAGMFVSAIKNELIENKKIRKVFGVKRFIKESETDIIVEMNDDHKFRIIARGAEQRVRGFLWDKKRPNMILVDDLEDDVGVMSKDRREKLRHWFYSALLPCFGTTVRIRVAGTILHLDSLLESLLGDEDWVTERFEAHSPTFRTILWQGRFGKAKLMRIRDSYFRRGIPEVYSREYLNWPIDETTSFFRKKDFRYIDFDLPVDPVYYAATDFAITKSEKSDFTATVVCCMDHLNRLMIVDVYRKRMDSIEIIDHIFEVQKKYNPSIFTMESDKIQKALGPILKSEMFKRNLYINMNPVNPSGDKMLRARSFNARMKAGGVYFYKDAHWFNDLQSEMIRFPKDKHDDQVDALSWIGMTIDKIQMSLSDDEFIDKQYDTMISSEEITGGGVCVYTGY